MITIANTFTILLAQRRRQGSGAAPRGRRRPLPVRNRFLAEAIALGVLGAGLGVLLGVGLAAAGAAITGSLYWGLALPVTDLAVAFVAGLLITVVAAWLPVLRGTRVRPLEALQPELSSDERRRAGWVRGAICGLLVAGGLAVALSSLTPQIRCSRRSPAVRCSRWASLRRAAVRPLAAARARRPGRATRRDQPAGPRRTPSRNPRRAAATATALMLAVGLIVTLQVGTASVRASMLSEIDQRRPVDAAVSTWGFETAVPADLREQLAQIPGVDATVSLPVGYSTSTSPRAPSTTRD